MSFRTLKTLWRDSSGQAAVEWLMVTAAVVLLCMIVEYYGGIILWHLFYRTAALVCSPVG